MTETAKQWWTAEDEARTREHLTRQRASQLSAIIARPRVYSSGAFVRDFSPPSYVVDGILQRGFLYSLTAPTGTGKTAIALRLAAHVALGRDFAGRGVERGRVVMLVGENADDVRARWIALSEQMSFDAEEIEVDFLPGIFPLPELSSEIESGVRANDRAALALVIVDTSPAYFQGEDENSNKELGDHARLLRSLTQLSGNPCVIANCHPTKNAATDNLLPRGGGAFIAEVDGNLCCSKTDRIVELHWQGKFRGPDFSPIPFELVPVTSPRLVDSRGRLMPTVIASTLSEIEQAASEDVAARELAKLLGIMADHPGASIAELAGHAGWIAGGKPYKSKVSRLLDTLKKQKLVTKELDAWVLTSAGEKAAKRYAK